MPLSLKDRETVRALREFGVLIEIQQPRFLEYRNGNILVFCGDGDQSVDLFTHHVSMMSECEQCRPHLLTLNGGALLLPPDSPVAKSEEGKVLFRQIIKSSALKKIPTIVLYSHAPCGAAMEAGISLLEQLHLLMKAKLMVKSALPQGTVFCLFHVDKGDTKRTYYVSRDAWNEWTEINSCPHLACR